MSQLPTILSSTLKKSHHELNVSSVLSPLPSSLYCLTPTKTTVQKAEKARWEEHYIFLYDDASNHTSIQQKVAHSSQLQNNSQLALTFHQTPRLHVVAAQSSKHIAGAQTNKQRIF
jgi:hypothetical protein